MFPADTFGNERSFWHSQSCIVPNTAALVGVSCLGTQSSPAPWSLWHITWLVWWVHSWGLLWVSYFLATWGLLVYASTMQPCSEVSDRMICYACSYLSCSAWGTDKKYFKRKEEKIVTILNLCWKLKQLDLIATQDARKAVKVKAWVTVTTVFQRCPGWSGPSRSLESWSCCHHTFLRVKQQKVDSPAILVNLVSDTGQLCCCFSKIHKSIMQERNCLQRMQLAQALSAMLKRPAIVSGCCKCQFGIPWWCRADHIPMNAGSTKVHIFLHLPTDGPSTRGLFPRRGYQPVSKSHLQVCQFFTCNIVTCCPKVRSTCKAVNLSLPKHGSDTHMLFTTQCIALTRENNSLTPRISAPCVMGKSVFYLEWSCWICRLFLILHRQQRMQQLESRHFSSMLVMRAWLLERMITVH